MNLHSEDYMDFFFYTVKTVLFWPENKLGDTESVWNKL